LLLAEREAEPRKKTDPIKKAIAFVFHAVRQQDDTIELITSPCRQTNLITLDSNLNIANADIALSILYLSREMRFNLFGKVYFTIVDLEMSYSILFFAFFEFSSYS